MENQANVSITNVFLKMTSQWNHTADAKQHGETPPAGRSVCATGFTRTSSDGPDKGLASYRGVTSRGNEQQKNSHRKRGTALEEMHAFESIANRTNSRNPWTWYDAGRTDAAQHW